MHSRLRPLLLLLPLSAMVATACSNNTTTSTTPTSIVTTTETFAGTLTKNGAVTHVFSATSRGTVTARLAVAQSASSTHRPPR